MVTNIPIHAEAACVLLYFAFDEGNKTRGIKNKNHHQTAIQINRRTRHRRAWILLDTTSILIAASEKNGAALGY